MKHWLRLTAVATALAFAVPAGAQDALKATWTDPDDPANGAVSAQMHMLKDGIERFSGGKYDVELYPNGQLGDQRSMVQQVRRGTIQFANIASGVLASLYAPELGIVDLPFLFDSRAHFAATMDVDSPFMKKLLDQVAADTGVRVLDLTPFGFRNLTTADTAVAKPEDLAGLKIRTMEIVPHQEMVTAMGGTPVPIPFLELYTSLQTGVVDGEENTPYNIIAQRFYQVQKHMTETQHVMTVGALITNEEWYQSLSDEDKAALRHAVEEARIAHDGIGAISDYLSVAKLKDEGMEVTTLSPEELQAFRDATIEPTKQWAIDNFGEEFVNGFFAHMEEAGQGY